MSVTQKNGVNDLNKNSHKILGGRIARKTLINAYDSTKFSHSSRFGSQKGKMSGYLQSVEELNLGPYYHLVTGRRI